MNAIYGAIRVGRTFGRRLRWRPSALQTRYVISVAVPTAVLAGLAWNAVFFEPPAREPTTTEKQISGSQKPFRFEDYEDLLAGPSGNFNERMGAAADAALVDLYEVFPPGSSVDALVEFIGSSNTSRGRYCETRDPGNLIFCQYAHPWYQDHRLSILWWLSIMFDRQSRQIQDIRISVRPS